MAIAGHSIGEILEVVFIVGIIFCLIYGSIHHKGGNGGGGKHGGNSGGSAE